MKVLIQTFYKNEASDESEISNESNDSNARKSSKTFWDLNESESSDSNESESSDSRSPVDRLDKDTHYYEGYDARHFFDIFMNEKNQVIYNKSKLY